MECEEAEEEAIFISQNDLILTNKLPKIVALKSKLILT